MSILNDIWNRIARKPDRRKAAVTETSETGNRVYAVATEEGVMLFSDTCMQQCGVEPHPAFLIGG